MAAIHDLLKDGRKHAVSERDYDYFLEVLPPVTGQMMYQGERWDFGFAEGADRVRLFKHHGTEYFAIETPYINPREAGSIDSQKRRWLMRWLQLGKSDPHLRRAGGPPFSTQSFHECRSHGELVGKVAQGGWPPGQAFYVADLCFINKGDVLGRWLAIKGDAAIGSLPLALIIEHDGADAAEGLLADLHAAGHEPGSQRRQMGR